MRLTVYITNLMVLILWLSKVAIAYRIKIILMMLMSVSFLFTSCQKTNESGGKEEFESFEEKFNHNSSDTRLTIYGEESYEKIPLSVNRIESNYRKTTSPDGQIIISEDIDVETKNSFGGATNFEKLHLTVGENPVCRYMKVYKDGSNRRIILQEGEEPQGDTLLKKAINFKPTVTYYSFYYHGEPYWGKYGIPDIIVRTTWGDVNDTKINELSIRKEKLTKVVAEILYQEHVFPLVKLWKWYITGEYQKDADGLSKEKLFTKYALSNEAKKKIEERISKIESLNTETKNLENENIEEEFITLLSKPDKVYKNGNVEYFMQKGITTQPLTGEDIFARYQEILNHLKESQDSQKPLLEGIIESFKEIKDNQGKTVIVLTGYSKIDPKTGFVEGEPSYIEFRIYPPPFRKLTYNQIKGRIQEIEKEIKKGEGKNEATLAYFKTLEYIQKEKEILEEILKIGPKTNSRLIVYLPEILLYHSGTAVETYTYKYDPKKGNEADSFRGFK